MYVTPQTDDGWVTKVDTDGEQIHIDVEFDLSSDFRALVQGREKELVFASRSRLARLGIDVRPTTELVPDGDVFRMSATVQAIIREYDVEKYLNEIILKGLKIGRLVFCPAERRLASEQVYEEVVKHSLQLPAAFSIDSDGRFNIQTHRCTYGLLEPLTLEDLRTVIARSDGQDLLNRIQVQRPVTHVVLEPGDGLITSCSMFLHRHYVVLDLESSALGQHLQAVVLDPISTRGTRVFLEFCNASNKPIVNPSVAGAIYEAYPVRDRSVFAATSELPTEPEVLEQLSDYGRLVEVFERFEGPAPGASYFDRTVAVVDDLGAVLEGGEPHSIWRRPAKMSESDVGVLMAHRDPPADRTMTRFGTRLLEDIDPDAGVTLFLKYFPNLVEHLSVCTAALEGKVRRIVFRHASYEHGIFLSARDHGRLADFHGLGLEVFWCNDVRRHVVMHVYRGLRGFFADPRRVERFKTTLILAIYGSTRALPDDDVNNLTRLLENLKEFFGDSIAILTGGGPGAMQQATDIAHSMDIPVGANFIETVDQQTNQTADYYQTFQGRSRHSRQRWFEVASFHLFCTGGVGTLEEVGLTLTDMKLGIMELSPIVFFGAHGDSPYWWPLRRQLEVMADNARAPEWVRSHVIMTNDPEAVTSFYRHTLGLG